MSSHKKSVRVFHKKKRRRRSRNKGLGLYSMKRILLIVVFLMILLFAILGVSRHRKAVQNQDIPVVEEISGDDPVLDVQLLTINEYSRPGIVRDQVNGIVIHYTANPDSSAQANRDYFEGLKDSHTTKASAHFIVGLDGEIIQCIPTNELAYASNNRNRDTVSIECCYRNEDGSFEPATYHEVIHLTAWLCEKFGLTSEDVIRHYDVTGKMCPKYYVDNPEQWDQFRADVDAYMNRD